jgi:hypothetical protein
MENKVRPIQPIQPIVTANERLIKEQQNKKKNQNKEDKTFEMILSSLLVVIFLVVFGHTMVWSMDHSPLTVKTKYAVSIKEVQ